MTGYKIYNVFGEVFSSYAEELISIYRMAEEEHPDDEAAMWEEIKKGASDFSDIESVCVTEREFETEAEAVAYCLGLEDMDGWMGSAGYEEEEAELLEKILEKVNG